MREIKFRAWDKENGMSRTFIVWEATNILKGLLLKYQTDDVPVIMQFTGLFDKNGKEIYEGDILENNTHRKQLIEVYWKGCVKDGENVNGKEWINWGGWYFRKLSNEKEMTYSVDNDQIEIIGNIYENPELIHK